MGAVQLPRGVLVSGHDHGETYLVEGLADLDRSETHNDRGHWGNTRPEALVVVPVGTTTRDVCLFVFVCLLMGFQ